MSPTIHDTGFTVVSPGPHEEDTHLVDIVIIHGLQGHPKKTWLYQTKATPPKQITKSRRRGILRALGLGRSTKSEDVAHEEQSDKQERSLRIAKAADSCGTEIFWPADLLPKKCPKARIMVYGYETRVTQGYGHTANQNSVFSHGQDLLYKLRRKREGHKPIIFIAHSLGGIVLKEALIHANNTRDPDSLEILTSTRAVVFLSTPHQGSDHAQLGEIARRIASVLGLDTNAALLDSLGLRNDDLRRSQQLFSNIWDERRFQLKTFQESRALVGFNVGSLNELVVPHKSSLLGLPGEDPETLNADHISMCKFTGPDDPDFDSFGHEIKRLYESTIRVDDSREPRSLSRVYAQDDVHEDKSSLLASTADREPLMSLAFGNMGLRKRIIERPSPGTCDWPLTHPVYRDWLTRTDVDTHHGLLWLAGHPGSGKSVLVKHLASLCTSHPGYPRGDVATYFFDARGISTLEKSMEGLLRDLLHQLLPLCETTLKELCAVHSLKDRSRNGSDHDVEWRPEELQDMLLKLCSKPRTTPLFLFVDAIDECHTADDKPDTDSRSVLLFLAKLATTAHRAHYNLNICISSRRHLTVSTVHCVTIVIDQVGHGDIERYALSTTSQWQLGLSRKAAISAEITKKACGIFLWARLALRLMAQAIDDGLQANLTAILQQIPCQLEAFFDEILKKLSNEQQEKSSRLFQWTLFAQRPLSLDEWLHVMALIDMPTMRSLRSWEESIYGIETVDQLAKRVAMMSGGLLEVTTHTVTEGNTETNVSTTSVDVNIERSVSAFAGSMDAFEGGVQFVHESVREYFLTGNGFKLSRHMKPAGDVGFGHVYIMGMCLRYAQLEELNWNTSGRSLSEDNRRAHSHGRPSSHVSVASFGASAANSIRRYSASGVRSDSQDSREMVSLLGRLPNSLRDEVGAWLENAKSLGDLNHSSGGHPSSHFTIGSSDTSVATSVHRDSTSTDLANAPDFHGMAQVLEIVSDGPDEDDARPETATASREINGSVSDLSSPSRRIILETPRSPSNDVIRNDRSVQEVTEPDGFPSHDESLSEESLSSDDSLVAPPSDSPSDSSDWEDSSPRESCHSSLVPLRFSHAALRLYVIDMFIHHAVAAAAEGADISLLLESIERERTIPIWSIGWRRWCVVNEGMRSDTTPAYFAAENGLHSWIDWYSGDRSWMLNEYGGMLRYPLVVAFSRGHDSLVSRLLPSVALHAQKFDHEGWTVAHRLAEIDGGEAVLSRLCAFDNSAATGDPALHRLLSSSTHLTPLDVLYERASIDLASRIARITPEQPGDAGSPLDRIIHGVRYWAKYHNMALGHSGLGRALLRSILSSDLESQERISQQFAELSCPRPMLCIQLLKMTSNELQDLLSNMRTSIPALETWSKLKFHTNSNSGSHDASEAEHLQRETIDLLVNALPPKLCGAEASLGT